MKPLWAIQGGIINDQDAQGMIEAITNLNLPYEILQIAPFDYTNIPDINYNGPIIPYGGTKFIDALRLIKPWVCFFNDNFRYHIAIKHYGWHMFNSDGQYMKMSEFSPSNYTKGEYLFIRPDKDIKEFAGNVVKPEDFMGWYRDIQGKGMDVNEDTEIIVSQASKINREWRTFIVDGVVVSASQYRKDHSLSKNADVPQEVYSFSKKMADLWSPAPVFVLDVCELKGELFVMEIGDFHSAGWYLSDKQKIIKAISDYTEKIFV